MTLPLDCVLFRVGIRVLVDSLLRFWQDHLRSMFLLRCFKSFRWQVRIGWTGLGLGRDGWLSGGWRFQARMVGVRASAVPEVGDEGWSEFFPRFQEGAVFYLRLYGT